MTLAASTPKSKVLLHFPNANAVKCSDGLWVVYLFYGRSSFAGWGRSAKKAWAVAWDGVRRDAEARVSRALEQVNRAHRGNGGRTIP